MPAKKNPTATRGNRATSSTLQASKPEVTQNETTEVNELPDFSSKKVWVFELIGIKPAVLKISNNDLRSYNKETQRYEAIRFCENEDSIWVSEQPEQVKKGFNIFSDGSLEVDNTETTRLEFLFRHPDYNKKFRLVDRDRDAKAQLQESKAVYEAQKTAWEMKLAELRVLAMAKGFPTESEAIMRTAMVDFARTNHEAFMDMLDNPIIKITAKLRDAMNKGVISNDGTHLRWADSGSKIITLPNGVEAVEYASRHFVNPTEGNTAFLQELDRKVS